MQLHSPLSYRLDGAPRVYVCRSKWGVPSHASRPHSTILRSSAVPDDGIRAHSSSSSSGAQESEAVALAAADRKQLWVAAIKAPMYSVGIVPVLVRFRSNPRSEDHHSYNHEHTECPTHTLIEPATEAQVPKMLDQRDEI